MSDDNAHDAAPLDANQIAAGVLAEMQAEVERLQDERIRALAELENVRKRAEKQVLDERQYGAAKFARDMLSVADNLRRAIDAAANHRGEPGVDALLTGVELTERELLAGLARNGVKPIEAEGAKFDPNFHQAMAELPGTGQPHGTVVDVIQPGYTIADRLLRAAMVVVAKGEPAAPQTPPGQAFDTKA